MGNHTVVVVHCLYRDGGFPTNEMNLAAVRQRLADETVQGSDSQKPAQ